MIAASSTPARVPTQADINARLTAYQLTRDAIRRAMAAGAYVPPDETSATLDALVAQGEAQRRELEGLNADLAEDTAEEAITNALALLDAVHALFVAFAATQLPAVVSVLPQALRTATDALDRHETAREAACRPPSEAVAALSAALESHGPTVRLLSHLGEYIDDVRPSPVPLEG
jgi:hypothetical protein